MNEVEIQAGYVHAETRKAIAAGKKIIIHKGGTGSGKTYDLTIFLLITYANTHPNSIVTVVSESKPHLDIGVIRYAKKLMLQTGIGAIANYNETKSYYTFPNGSIVEFFSADRIDKALGARRNVLYGNEINSLKESVWDELARRSDIVIGDFNPTSEFWLERWLGYYDDTIVIKSNYLNNKFLPENERARIQRRAERDENFRRVHIECEYGGLEGLIFPDVTLIDELPSGSLTFGLDFGYTADPTAVVSVLIKDNNLYIDEVIYSTGLRNSDIDRHLRNEGVSKSRPIYADSAEPKSIDDLFLLGWNIHPATKGRDSVMYGIDLMRQYNIHITKRSLNVIREFRNYTFAKDKTGKPLNEPVDNWNHSIDAIRYAVSMMQRAKHEYEPLRTDHRRVMAL